MGLEDDLKAKALALISQQMANWVVEIQRMIGEHQANLVRNLDELQETVARYDERINEEEIGAAMTEAVASNPAPAADYSRLKTSLGEIEKGASLSEVLTYLVNEVSQFVDRAAMFIVKGQSAIGWYARGVEPAEAIKSVNVPLSADTVFRNVHNSRRALRGHVSHSPGTAQALSRLGSGFQGVLAVPLVLRDKLAAILYCDSYQEEIPGPDADLIEILVHFAGKSIDLISSSPRAGGATTSGGISTDKVAAIRAGGEEMRERAGIPRSAAPPPPTPAGGDEAASTVMFSASAFQAHKPQPTAPRPAPVAAPSRALSPEEQKAHEDAKRFARLVVSEIKLYNESKVSEGRRNKDLYERLKEDIERGRQMYHDRVAPQVRDSTNYFYDELVRILAGGDAAALGPM
jgi:hypothetical protein